MRSWFAPILIGFVLARSVSGAVRGPFVSAWNRDPAEYLRWMILAAVDDPEVGRGEVEGPREIAFGVV